MSSPELFLSSSNRELKPIRNCLDGKDGSKFVSDEQNV